MNHFARILLAAALLVGTLAAFGQTIPGRYIVELSSEPVAGRLERGQGRAALLGAAAGEHRARVGEEQRALSEQVERRQARVYDRVGTVANALFVEATAEQAGALAALPGVKRVTAVRQFRRLLDRAMALHRVQEAWDQAGLEHAGAGIRIAIIDPGIDINHPGLNDPQMKAPDGFPRASAEADLAYTSGKVIVARSYVPLLRSRDPDPSPADRVGHGTALGMAAAGRRISGPLAAVAGVAPKAYLGSYKVFGTPGINDGTSEDVVLKALDDAVADGMDIINLSLGDDLAPRPDDDLEVQAIERASRAGVIVVVATGNNGPNLNTISSPATAPSAISVGASTNDRTFAASVEVSGLAAIIAITASGQSANQDISGPLADIASLDQDGLACNPLPSGSLAGKVALILRGSCFFEVKVTNVQRAGAVGALVYATAESPSPVLMGLGLAVFPAQMVSNADGLAIKRAIATQEQAAATMKFARSAVPVAGKRIVSFSAAGPSADLGIKPDLLATGSNLYVATQSLDVAGGMYDASGFTVTGGTSFSAPLVAGAAALLKAARPGLSAAQYRSLLVNSAMEGAQVAGVQRLGAGLLDLQAALNTTVAASPVSLSFGAGGGDPNLERKLSLTNLGGQPEEFTIRVVPRETSAAPVVSQSSVRLGPGFSADVSVQWKSTNLFPGPHEGVLSVRAESTGRAISVPYWYSVAATAPALISVLDVKASGQRGGVVRDAISFRVLDTSGVNFSGARPAATAVSGGGVVRGIYNYDRFVPGLFSIDVLLGVDAGPNVFRIQVGDMSRDVTITGQ